VGLAVRIIPVLLQRGASLVKGVKFDSWRSVGHVLQAAMVHQQRGVDELIVLDIAATPEGRGPNCSDIWELTEKCLMPLTVGGGVRSVEDVGNLFNAGADKVSICTAAVADRAFIKEASSEFGRQAIVIAIDVKAGRLAVRCGREVLNSLPSPKGIALQAIGAEECGAGEILLTSIDRDGTLEGYDLDLIRAVSGAVDIPVIANGGCGTYEHMYEAIQAGASAVAAGAMFQFTDQTPKGAAEYLAEKGIETR